MIPRKLELKNFLCYGEKTVFIDFRQYNLICFSGKNGNGKSALLDAITWAIWGQARKVQGAVKADAGLVRLGQTRMMVALEFEFNQTLYRVRREYAKTYGKPYACLDFETFDAAGDRFVSLTDKTIRKTQAKIERLLGIDFETFINSSFIKQGQSNEFSQRTPKERKQVLATILGLEKYEKMYQLALAKIRKKSEEKKFFEHLIEQHRQEYAQEETVLSELKNKKAENSTINKALDELKKTISSYERQKLRLSDVVKKQSEIEELLKKTALKKQKLLVQLKTCLTEWKKIHCRSLRLPDKEKLHSQRLELVSQDKEMLQQQKQSLQLQEQILKTKNSLATLTRQFMQKHDEKNYAFNLAVKKSEIDIAHISQQLLQSKDKQKSIVSDIDRYIKDHEKIKKDLLQRSAFEKSYQKENDQFFKRRTYYHKLTQRGNHIRSELAAIASKQEAMVNNEESPSCPLCQQILTAKRKRFIAKQFQEQTLFLEYRLKRVSMVLKRLKDILLKQHKEVESLTEENKSYIALAVKKDELSLKLVELNRESVDVAKQIEGLLKSKEHTGKDLLKHRMSYEQHQKSVESMLKGDDAIKKCEETLVSLEKKKQGIAFDSKAYQRLQNSLKNVDELLQQSKVIEHDIKMQHVRRHDIKQFCSMLKEQGLQEKEYKNQLEHLKRDSRGYNDVVLSIDKLEQEIHGKLKEKDRLLHVIGGLEQKLQQLHEAKGKEKEVEKKLFGVRKVIDDYQTLATIFSKNGIQALLIEQAIPEIENEANTILAKLTNNQSQIFIESLRDLKSGGVKETLDIKIADSMGVRPYEMFSGGEAFRIDFSMRLAISKLLSRRAGTALQTLIIDEGFGSQDEDGLARLMNAIHAIQCDFSKIIIVSHLEEFKNNFPVHFVIAKGSSGSTVTVEERG